MESIRSEILRMLDPPSGYQLWHGGATTLGSLRGVDHVEAVWRPAPGRKSIWEFTLHVAYWKYAVRRRIEGGEHGSFARSPSDWPAIPDEPDKAAWKEDRTLLREEDALLIEMVRALPGDRLGIHIPESSPHRVADLLFGVALHDTYHTAQIQLTKRLFAERSA